MKFDIHKINLNDYYKKSSFNNYVVRQQSNNKRAFLYQKLLGKTQTTHIPQNVLRTVVTTPPIRMHMKIKYVFLSTIKIMFLR